MLGLGAFTIDGTDWSVGVVSAQWAQWDGFGGFEPDAWPDFAGVLKPLSGAD